MPKNDELNVPISVPIDEVEFSEFCMTTSEALLLLEKRKKADDDAGREQTVLQQSAMRYCETFARYRTTERMQDIRRALESAGLNPGQVAIMASLCPADVDIARAIVPGLQSFQDSDIKKMLTDIQKYSTF